MIDNTNNIQSGMDVFGSDGEKIGKVADVYASGWSGGTPGTTWQAGSGVGELDIETVSTAETGTPGDTSFRDPSAPGASYTNESVTGTTYTDPTSSNPGYTTGTSDFTGSTGSGTGSFAGSTAPQGMGGMGTATATSTGFFKVEHGGIFGIGATDLYIPFSDVATVVPGDSVTVSCTKDECGDRYAHKPDFLNDEDSGPLT